MNKPCCPHAAFPQENKKAQQVFGGGENPSWLQIPGLHYSWDTVIPRGVPACAQHPAFACAQSVIF